MCYYNAALTIVGLLLTSVTATKPLHVIVDRSHLSYTAARDLEFGDFAEDIPEECPATTTCPVVCRSNVTDCPTVCDDGLTLCSTGNCEIDCTVHDSKYENPCGCESLRVACPKTIDLYPVCYDRFQQYYDNNAACLESQVDEVKLVPFDGLWFLVCYFGFAGIAVSVVVWCFLNQVVFPVKSSTRPLESAKKASNETWTQTGYKAHWIGALIYLLVEFSFVVIQFLLLLTTLFYYMQQKAITKWTTVFEDEIQVLKVFQIVWMFGFVWCFSFRYPCTGLDSLFLRRCELHEATHVAVVAPVKQANEGKVSASVRHSVSLLWAPIDRVFRTFFSYPYGQPGMETVFCPIDVDWKTGTRSILHRMRRYVYDSEISGFTPCLMSVGTTFGHFFEQIGGLTQTEADDRRGRQGPNIIPVSKPSIIGSLCKEFGKAFYLYQNFIVWSFANFFYYFMAIVYTVIRVAGALIVTYFRYTSECLLYKLAVIEGVMVVLRDGVHVEISVEDVVPGDVVVLTPGAVHCDMVVLQGFRVLVDESALTGEATPVLKAQVDRSQQYREYSPNQHKSCTMFAGTEILEIDGSNNALGIVTTTGSFTTKGELLTDVLSSERHKFQFDEEVKIVIGILLLQSIFLIALVFYSLNDHWVYSWFYGVYILASALNPLLPTICIVSVCISAKRLQDKRISCPYLESILMAGKVDSVFFDKTGTITKDGLEFMSCIGSPSDDRIRLGMAVCHTLSTSKNGDIVGNQVDLESFRSTGAILSHEKGGPTIVSYRDEQFTAMKKFEFDNRTSTQSVIVEDGSGKRQIFVKGSSEVIKGLCMPSSIPNTYDESVRTVSKGGAYQIAMAFRSYNLDMDMADVRREDVEQMLTFAGFINFRNEIRQEASQVLNEIRESEMPLAMITGDNILTGIYVAREAGLINMDRSISVGQFVKSNAVEWFDFDRAVEVEAPLPNNQNDNVHCFELALTGEAWNFLSETDPVFLASIQSRIRVFGRCKPSDKVSIVDAFAARGSTTLMCGDGQNDCGCLKAAHVGVALSDAEASIVSPFASLDKNLFSVVEVLREGRCAVAATVSVYSYYIVYGQAEVILQVIMAYLSVSLSEWCWMFLDGIWSISLAFSIPLSKAASRLSARRPTDSLLGSEVLYSVCGIIGWNFLFVVFALIALFQQDWFQCRKWNSDDVSNPVTIGDNYESSVLFVVGGYQYISSAIVLSFGYTFRQAWYRNVMFVILSFTWTLFYFIMTVFPSAFSCLWRVNCENENAVRFVTSFDPVAINNPFHTTLMPMPFRWLLVFIMATNFVTILVWQRCFVHGYLSKRNDIQKKI